MLIYFSLLSSDLSPTEVQNDHMILCLDLLDCDSHMGLTKKVIDRYGKVSQQLLKNEYLWRMNTFETLNRLITW